MKATLLENHLTDGGEVVKSYAPAGRPAALLPQRKLSDTNLYQRLSGPLDHIAAGRSKSIE
jgi:hypothetical protein